MDDGFDRASAPGDGTDGLYDRDFYAWTQAQADLLRQGLTGRIDLPNLAEEIETLGRKEIAELRSRFTVLVRHLLKQIHQPERAGRSWPTTILISASKSPAT